MWFKKTIKVTSCFLLDWLLFLVLWPWKFCLKVIIFNWVEWNVAYIILYFWNYSRKVFSLAIIFWQGYMKNKSDKICFSFYCLNFVFYIMTNLFLMPIYTLANIIRKNKKFLRGYIWAAKWQRKVCAMI